MTSDDLWRAALHDFNNLLASLQGVLDLSDPRLPLDVRNRMRLEFTLEDGKTLIAMARALALDRHPEMSLAPWSEWKGGLEARLEPMSAMFRCPIELLDSGADGAPGRSPSGRTGPQPSPGRSFRGRRPDPFNWRPRCHRRPGP